MREQPREEPRGPRGGPHARHHRVVAQRAGRVVPRARGDVREVLREALDPLADERDRRALALTARLGGDAAHFFSVPFFAGSCFRSFIAEK